MEAPDGVENRSDEVGATPAAPSKSQDGAGGRPEEHRSDPDWAAAIHRIEQAALVIQDYERKLAAIENDTQALLERVGQEQVRSETKISRLEQDLIESRARADAAESKLASTEQLVRDLRIENADGKRRLDEAERHPSSGDARTDEYLIGAF